MHGTKHCIQSSKLIQREHCSLWIQIMLTALFIHDWCLATWWWTHWTLLIWSEIWNSAVVGGVRIQTHGFYTFPTQCFLQSFPSFPLSCKWLELGAKYRNGSNIYMGKFRFYRSVVKGCKMQRRAEWVLLCKLAILTKNPNQSRERDSPGHHIPRFCPNDCICCWNFWDQELFRIILQKIVIWMAPYVHIFMHSIFNMIILVHISYNSIKMRIFF